jgi:hypothetical protein
MSVYGSGRAAVVELSAPRVQELIQRFARTNASGACFSGVPVWVNAATIRQDAATGATAEITLSTGGSASVPVSVFTTDVDMQLRTQLEAIFLDPSLVDVRDFQYRAVEDGALAIGVTMAGPDGQPRAGDEWNAFTRNFLTGGGRSFDWAIAIDPTLLLDIVRTKLRALHGPGNAGSTDIEIHSTDARWEGQRLIVTANGNAVGYFGDPGFTITAEYRFIVVPSTNRLYLTRLRAAFDPVWWAEAATRWHAEEIRAALLEGTDPARFVQPILLRFSLPDGSRLLGTFASVRDGALIIAGDAEITLPPPPHLNLFSRNAEVYELPRSACADSTATPLWPAVQVTIQNGGPGKLWICGVEKVEPDAPFSFIGTSDPRIGVAADRDELTGFPLGLATGEQLVATLVYLGPRTDADCTVRVRCNDRDRLVADLPLRVVTTGELAYTVTPEELVITRHNTPTGDAELEVRDCREHFPSRADRSQQPAGFIEIFNSGELPIYLCGAMLAEVSQDTPFQLRFDDEPLIPPGGYKAIAVYFFPTEVDREYQNTVLVDLNVERRRIPLRGRLVPEAFRRSGDIGHDGGLLEHIIDLAGEALCAPPMVDVCRACRLFEPAQPKGSRTLGVIRLHPVPPEVELVLEDERGEPLVRELSGDRRREVIVEYPIPGEGFRGNPCIARYAGARDAELSFMRLRLSGLLLTPEGDAPDSGPVRAAAAGSGVLFAGTEQGLQVIDWTQADRPRVLARVELPSVRALARRGTTLYAMSDTELFAFNVADPGRPVRMAAVQPSEGLRGLTGSGAFLYLVNGRELVVVESADRSLRVVRRQPMPDGAYDLAGTDVVLCLAGQKSLTLLSLANPADPAVQDVRTCEPSPARLTQCGARFLVHGTKGSQAFTAKGASLRQTAVFAQTHWSAECVATLAPDRVVTLDENGGVRAWRMRTHRLDRRPFMDALKLRYSPPK